MPDVMPLVNLNDTHHLECLTWAVYDRTLLVGSHLKLLGEHQWCTVLTGIFKHIYIAHPIPWHHGTASRELKWFVKNIDKMLHVVDMMMDVELGDRDQGVAPGIVLRCQTKRDGPDTPAAPQHTAAKVPLCGRTLFPKLGHHTQALLGHEHTGICQV